MFRLALIFCVLLSVSGCRRFVTVTHEATWNVGRGVPIDDPSLDPFRVADFVIGLDIAITTKGGSVALGIYGDGDPASLDVGSVMLIGPQPLEVESVLESSFRPYDSPESQLLQGFLTVGRVTEDIADRIHNGKEDLVFEVEVSLGVEEHVLVFELARDAHWTLPSG